ncbi:MAG: hypothetical protein LC792_09565 [Actinobacteria bacterium]|nr:hypothetical protein [Actinomycetota bacterium]
MRVAALEDNVAFLEQWCEEQQDALDRAAGPLAYDYELEPAPPPRQILRVVDLRDGAGANGGGDGTGPDPEPSDVEVLVAVVETDHDRLVRQIRARVDQLRRRLALSVAPPAEAARPQPPEAEHRSVPRPGPAPIRRVSAKQAGRTAP